MKVRKFRILRLRHHVSMVYRLLEHLYHGNASDVLYRLIIHLLRGILIFSHIGHGFLVGHKHLHHKPRNQQEYGQAP